MAKKSEAGKRNSLLTETKSKDSNDSANTRDVSRILDRSMITDNRSSIGSMNLDSINGSVQKRPRSSYESSVSGSKRQKSEQKFPDFSIEEALGDKRNNNVSTASTDEKQKFSQEQIMDITENIN